MTDQTSLVIRNFAQIRSVSIEFGDLTVLVGAQGTGKSLALQWLKAVVDGRHIVAALRDAGEQGRSEENLVELIFGAGMGTAWRVGSSEILFNSRAVSLKDLSRRGGDTERVFFIPAHRSALISEGWAAPFLKLTSDTPVVARIFSQKLFDRFSSRGGDQLFPVSRLLKQKYRELIDDAVYHGGLIALEQDHGGRKRLRLMHGSAQLPFMTWTAGQREFTPLLLGLYALLPRTKQTKDPSIDWAIIEEPEMGLHPQAITVFLLLVLDLLWRGYRVVLSTHSPQVLTAVWMLQRLKENHARWQLVCQAFNVPATAELQKVAKASLQKLYRVHYLEFGTDGKVTARDISGLNPDAGDPAEAEWGGLTRFSSRFGDAVRTSVNESA